MATENFFRSTKFAIEKLKEATFNTANGTTSGLYSTLVLNQQINPVLPDPGDGITDDAGRGGREDHTNLCRTGYWTPPRFGFVGDVDTELCGRFGIDALGGTIGIVNSDTSAYTHTAQVLTPAQMAAGTLPPSHTVVVQNSNHDFRFNGCMVNSYEIAQQGGAIPTYAAELVGTGKFANPALTASAVVPAPAAGCSDNPTVALSITDADGTRNLFTDGDLIGWRFFCNNNIDPTSSRFRRGDDASAGPTGGTLKYIARMLPGFPRTKGAELTVNFNALTGAKGYWEQLMTTEALTNLILTMTFSTLAGAATVYKKIVWTYPAGHWRQVSPGNTNDIYTQTLAFLPKDDGSTDTCGATFAVTNTTATGFS